jgi:hypothetical protein
MVVLGRCEPVLCASPTAVRRVKDSPHKWSRNTVWNLLGDGRPKGISVGRRRLIPRVAVEDFISQGGT